MKTRPIGNGHHMALCENNCSPEHGCGVPVTGGEIASGEWERKVLLAHWSVLTMGAHSHKPIFCSITCLSEWSMSMLLFRPPGAPIGAEPTDPSPRPEQRN